MRVTRKQPLAPAALAGIAMAACLGVASGASGAPWAARGLESAPGLAMAGGAEPWLSRLSEAAKAWDQVWDLGDLPIMAMLGSVVEPERTDGDKACQAAPGCVGDKPAMDVWSAPWRAMPPPRG